MKTDPRDVLHLAHLAEQIARVEQEVEHLSGTEPWTQRVPFLLQLPGFGLLTTMTVLAAVGGTPAPTAGSMIRGNTRTNEKGERWQEHGLVFTTGRGTPISPRNLVRHFKINLEEAGLPEIRFHDLRHTAASLLLERNTHPKIVQELLGHSNITLTLDTYSHLLPSMQREAARTMDDLVGQK